MRFKTQITIICFYVFSHNIFSQPLNLVNTKGAVISTRFLTPKGYLRIVSSENSFAYFLQQQALKLNGSLVHLYNGNEKQNKVAAAILNVDFWY